MFGRWVAPEPVEGTLAVLTTQPWAVVDDVQLHPWWPRLDVHADRPPCVGCAQGIGDEVVDGLCDSAGQCPRAAVGGNVDGQLDPLLAGDRTPQSVPLVYGGRGVR